MGLVAKTEITSAFINEKEVVPIRNALKFLGYLQLPAPIQDHNTKAVNFARRELKGKHS